MFKGLIRKLRKELRNNDGYIVVSRGTSDPDEDGYCSRRIKKVFRGHSDWKLLVEWLQGTWPEYRSQDVIATDRAWSLLGEIEKALKTEGHL